MTCLFAGDGNRVRVCRGAIMCTETAGVGNTGFERCCVYERFKTRVVVDFARLVPGICQILNK